MAAVILTKYYREFDKELGTSTDTEQTDYLQSHQRHGLNMESLPFKTKQGHIPHLFP